MTNITTWIDEYHKGSRFGLNGKILIKKTSKFQEIIVIENKYYGKANARWLLDDIIKRREILS